MKGGSDLDLAESVCTWLCHALSGSVGAVVNGLELLREENQTLLKETVGLVDLSATAAVHRLRFFRAVFGVTDDTYANASAARDLLLAFLSASRGSVSSLTVAWPERWLGTERVDPRVVQLALAMALVGAECLPRAGTLVVREEASALIVVASGRGGRLDEGSAAALTRTPGRLTPRSVPSLFAARLARRLHGEITATFADDLVELTAAPLAVTVLNK